MMLEDVLPETPQPRKRQTWMYAGALALFLCAAAFSYAMFPGLALRSGSTLRESGAPSNLPEGFPVTAPSPTASDITNVQGGFQHLVSYSDNGLRPGKLTASPGERIRFTNNSRQQIQVTAAFVHSPLLSPGAYWEVAIPATSTRQISFGVGKEAGSILIQ